MEPWTWSCVRMPASETRSQIHRMSASAGPGGIGVWPLLCLFAVQQAFFAVNQPTRSAVLSKLLPAELLPAANALSMTVMQAGAIAGPLAAGVLIPVVGFQWLYLVDTLERTIAWYRDHPEARPEGPST